MEQEQEQGSLTYLLDRIVPAKGYVKENIIIISLLANSIKSSATPTQILKVGNFYKELLHETH